MMKITATVHYRLSLVGQRAALLAGLSGAVDQTIVGEIGEIDLDLAEIQSDGSVVADLRGDLRDHFDGCYGARYHSFDARPESAAAALAAVRDVIAAHNAASRASAAADKERAAAFAARLAQIRPAIDAYLADHTAREIAGDWLSPISEDEVWSALDEDAYGVVRARHDSSPIYRVEDPGSVSAAAWDTRARILAAMPGLQVEFRLHQGSFRGEDIRVEVVHGPFTLRREYAAE